MSSLLTTAAMTVTVSRKGFAGVGGTLGAGMIIPIVGQTAFATLLFRQFFVNVPRELVEAARIDGAGWFNVLGRIAIPLARPAIAAYCSVTFLGAWNMYIWPLVALSEYSWYRFFTET